MTTCKKNKNNGVKHHHVYHYYGTGWGGRGEGARHVEKGSADLTLPASWVSGAFAALTVVAPNREDRELQLQRALACA